MIGDGPTIFGNMLTLSATSSAGISDEKLDIWVLALDPGQKVD